MWKQSVKKREGDRFVELLKHLAAKQQLNEVLEAPVSHALV